MLIMMQEKCWTAAFFQAYTLKAGIGKFMHFYIFIVKEVRIYKLGALTMNT